MFLFAEIDKFSCDFEDNICQWTQDKSDDFDWTRNRALTPLEGTGPHKDHTKGLDKCYILLVEILYHHNHFHHHHIHHHYHYHQHYHLFTSTITCLPALSPPIIINSGTTNIIITDIVTIITTIKFYIC
jgi:hypothetical protein